MKTIIVLGCGSELLMNRLMEREQDLIVVSGEIPEYTPPALEPLQVKLHEPRVMTCLPSKGSKYHK
jgi:hypothetical protein